jgi:hypothetical protein
MTTKTNEPEGISRIRRHLTVLPDDTVEITAVWMWEILAAYDAIVVKRDEWRDAAKWAENQHQHWKTVAEAATAQRDAAVRDRDALRHELKIAQMTVLVERDYIEQLRAERDEAVRERDKYAHIVSAIREGGTDDVRIAVRDGIRLLTRKKYTLCDAGLIIDDAYRAALVNANHPEMPERSTRVTEVPRDQ